MRSGRRDRQAPSSRREGSGGAAFEYASTGLASLLAGLGPSRGCRILDLGRASSANLDFYRTFASTVRFVDLLCEPLAAGDIPPAGACLSTGVLAGLLPLSAGPFDAVLAWDLPSYLDASTLPALMARVAECGRPGTRLLAMLVAADTMPAQPLRFTVLDGARVRGVAVSRALRGGRDLSPAAEQRQLAPFAVEHSVVLRHGMREYLLCLH